MSIKTNTDYDKQYIKTGKDGRINGFVLPDLQYSALGKLIIYRLKEDRDLKILVTSKGKTTGTGKTTAAIILAKWVNKVRNYLFDMQETWRAKDYTFMDVWEYLERYREAKPGDALITDELEYMVDRRRSMSNQNVKFSQAWSVLRYKNVVTIGTAPHLSDLDKRTVETADVWINVTQKGRANTYYLTMDDFEWTMEPKRLKVLGFREALRWGAIEDDPDYRWLKEQKEDIGVPGIDDMEQIDEQDLNELEREIRTESTKNLLAKLHKYDVEELSQSDIADVTGYSQPQVSKIKRQMVEDDELSA